MFSVRNRFFFISKNLINIKVLIAATLMLIWSYLYVNDYITLSKATSNLVNVIEPTVYLLSNSSFPSFVFVLCFIFFYCDVPFADGILPYYIYRAGYKKWYFNLISFAFVLSVLLLTIPISVSLLVCAKYGYFSNEVWSDVVRIIANGGAPRLGFLPTFSTIITLYSPIEALLCAFVLRLLHFLIISCVLMILNCLFKKTLGVAVVMVCEISGYMLTLFYPKIARAFPFINTSLYELTHFGISKNVSSAPYVWEACIYCLVVIVLLCVIGYFILRKYRFEFGESK